MAPRAPEKIVRPRRRAGVVARPLSFTVSRHPKMRRLGLLTLVALIIYVVLFAIALVRFEPRSIEAKQRARITLGAPASEVSKIFAAGAPFDTAQADYCKTGVNVSRIALLDDGGFWFFPLPSTLTTTTTFCFDSTDHLVGLKTGRWVVSL